MFKRVIFLGFLLVSLSAHASEPRQITIGGFGKSSLLPYHWFNYCTNEMEGSNIQLVKWIFKSLNIQVKLAAPVSINSSNIGDRDKALKSGELDALFAVSSRSSAKIIKVKIPIIESGLSIFYPTKLGQLENTDKLHSFQGVFLPVIKGRKTGEMVKRWAELNQLKVAVVLDKEKFETITRSTEDHFIILSRYSEKIDRKRYNILENKVTESYYYFALADRPPWNEMFPVIDQKFEFAKTSGLMSLLKETSFQRWLKEKNNILACEQALEAK